MYYVPVPHSRQYKLAENERGYLQNKKSSSSAPKIKYSNTSIERPDRNKKKEYKKRQVSQTDGWLRMAKTFRYMQTWTFVSATPPSENQAVRGHAPWLAALHPIETPMIVFLPQ